jgi:hypothetical protein
MIETIHVRIPEKLTRHVPERKTTIVLHARRIAPHNDLDQPHNLDILHRFG